MTLNADALQLAQQLVLITGASRGLGACLARAFLGQGARVVVNYLERRDAAQAVAAHAPDRALAVQANVRDPEAVRAMVAKAREHFEGPVTTVVNIALPAFSFNGDARPGSDTLSWDKLDQQLQGVARGSLNTIQAALPGMRAPVAILPGLVTYVAPTEAEAKARQRALDELLPTEDSLIQLGRFIGQECRDWPLDAPVPDLPPLEDFPGPKGRYATILRIIEREAPTLRQLPGRLAAGGGHCTMVGTPDEIADEMQRWIEAGGADGFNLMPPSLPDSIEDFIDQVVPVLQARGLFRRDYAGHKLRDHLGLPHPPA